MDLDPTGSLDERDWETTASVDPLRVAVVGLGGFTRGRALPALAAADHCEPAVAVTGDPDAAADVAAEYDLAATLSYEEYADGAAVSEYDAVYVCTPNALHLPHVETAAGHGKAVCCEKPLEATVERSRALVAACADADVPLMTAYRMQTDPALRRCRELVREGAIGDPVTLRGEFSFDIRGLDPDQWRLDAELSGGGALMDIGVYPLNAARFVLDAEPVAASGTVSSLDTPGGHFDEVEATVAWWLAFAGEQRPGGAFTTSYAGHTEDTLQVVGTEGLLRLEDAFGTEQRRTIVVERDDETARLRPANANEVVEEFDYFAHAVRTGAPIEPDGADGLRDVEVMAAVYESAERGERVSL